MRWLYYTTAIAFGIALSDFAKAGIVIAVGFIAKTYYGG